MNVKQSRVRCVPIR